MWALQRRAGNRATAAHLSRRAGTVQRNVDIELADVNRDDPPVQDVVVTGRGGSLFGGSEGDHSAAHALFRDAIAGRLLGNRLSRTPAVLWELFHAFANLPGWSRRDEMLEEHLGRLYGLVSAAESAIQAAEDAISNTALVTAQRKSRVEHAAQALLEMRKRHPADRGGVRQHRRRRATAAEDRGLPPERERMDHSSRTRS
ncbi:MAG TPA: hypothetical protein VIT41_11690 [Microlunatus sp.]